MTDLVPPHPLVLTIGFGLSQHGDEDLKTAVEALRAAVAGLESAESNEGGTSTVEESAESNEGGTSTVENAVPTAAIHDDRLAFDEKNAVAEELGQQLGLRDLTLFAGYLGPNLAYKGETWRQLYLDERLQSWLLAPRASIVGEQRQNDENAAFGKRDAMWVKGDARVLQGGGPQPMERRFLVGDLTRAADVDPAPAGGTSAQVTGLFCQVRTPGGCYGARSR